MKIYPAIDLKSGECVRLYQGRYGSVTVYEKNPITMAQRFADAGASMLHIVDLDGAKAGSLKNADIIFKIAQQTKLKIQMGGGIRTKKQISDILGAGIDKVILGSVAVSKCMEVKDWITEFGADRIVLALDVIFDITSMPKLALQAWQSSSQTTLWQLLDEYGTSALKHVLCTDVSRDGTLQGPNVKFYQKCVYRYPSIHFQASGGVSSLGDIRALAAIPVSSVVIGKALYENCFTLNAALSEVSSC